MTTEDALVASDGTRLAVRHYGGPPNGGRGLVLVHGLASNGHIWDAVGPQLAADFRVIAYDQRSHGRSDDAVDYSFHAFAGDCAEVSRLAAHPLVVGHSWGASVALHCAASCPEIRGVVCVDGAMFDWQSMGMDWETTERMLRPPEIEGPADDVLAVLRARSQVSWGKGAEAVVGRSFLVGDDGIMRRRTPVSEHMKIVRSMWEDRISDVYARVKCPILLVPARSPEQPQPFADAKRAAVDSIRDVNPRVRVEWIDSVHDIPLAKPDELSATITRFASSL